MIQYSATGVTKSGEIKISRPVYALVIQADQAFSAFTNEKITAYVEKSNGTNIEIATNTPMIEIFPLLSHGISHIIEEAGTTRLMLPIGPGAIALEENASIKILLDGLKSLVTYTVAYIEAPVLVETPYRVERKVATTDDSSRVFDVREFETVQISGMSAITEVFLTYANGQTNKYVPLELKAIAEFEDPAFLSVDGVLKHSPTNAVVFDLNEVIQIEIQKDNSAPVYLTLKR